MPKRYIARTGDCIASIAYEHGHFSDTVWNDPANAGLKSKRGDPYVLAEGDELVIPDLRIVSVSRALDKTHRFRRRGVPEKLSVQLIDDDVPFANRSYTLDVDGTLYEAETDADGVIEHWIAPNARHAELVLVPVDDEEPESLKWTLELGALAPIDEPEGIVARIENLQLNVLPEGDEQLPAAEYATKAIVELQVAEGLPPTGELDQATLAVLQARHGS